MYATVADLLARFGTKLVTDLTDRDNSGSLDETVAAQALVDASAMIDGYLASRYALPISPIPAMLPRICCDLAAYILCTGDIRPTDDMRKRHEDGLAWLNQVNRGQLDLGLTPTGTAPPETGGPAGVSFKSRQPRVFDSESLSDYGFRRGWPR